MKSIHIEPSFSSPIFLKSKIMRSGGVLVSTVTLTQNLAWVIFNVTLDVLSFISELNESFVYFSHLDPFGFCAIWIYLETRSFGFIWKTPNRSKKTHPWVYLGWQLRPGLVWATPNASKYGNPNRPKSMFRAF